MSPTPEPTPTHRRGKAVDAAILSATVATIVKAGTTAISIEQVAAEAGVNKTTVYRRWPKVDDLVLAALVDQAATNVPIPSTGDLEADLTELCRLVRDSVSSPLGQALLGAGRSNEPAMTELRQQFWAQRLEAAAAVLDQAAARGACIAPEDPVFVIEQLVGPIHFRVTEQQRPFGDDEIAGMIQRVLRDLQHQAS